MAVGKIIQVFEVAVNLRTIKIGLSRGITWFSWLLLQRQSASVSHIPVLCYHRVLPDLVEEENPVYSLLPEQFESQLAFLAREGFSFLSLQELADLVREGRPPENRSVMITFDDGYADNHAIAWPLARRYHAKLNLFICTGIIGATDPVIMRKDGYLAALGPILEVEDRAAVRSHMRNFPKLWRSLTWQELREMQASGVSLGFHGHHHRLLARPSPAELTADISAGLAVFEKELGYRPKFFALPYGWSDSYNREVIRALQKFDFDFIFTTHLGRVRLPFNRSTCPRIVIWQQDDLATFQRKLYGAYDWLEKMRRLTYSLERMVGKPEE